MNPHRTFHFLSGLIVLSLIAGLTGCGQPQPTAVPTTTEPPPTATLPPTATPTPLPTATATPTPKPSATPTLQPSPTPVGFYNHFEAGFSLVYPPSMEVIEETAYSLTLGDQKNDIYFDMRSYGGETETASTILTRWQESDKSTIFTKLADSSTITIGTGYSSSKTDLLLTSGQYKYYMRLIVAYDGKRNYLIQIIRGTNDFDKVKSTLDPLLASLHFFKPQPYDLPPEQTLYQLGSNPLPKDMDPAQDGTMYIGLIFSGLIRLTPELKIVPGLAEKWSVSNDGTVYTFTLYKDLKFANGNPITAKTVQASWERTTDPKFKSLNASTYLGDILGVKDKLAGKASTIAGLKVIDDQTLQVTLDGAKPYFLSKLNFPTAAVIDVNEAELKPKDWMLTASASGPYKIKELIEDEAIIFERNPNYPVQPAVQYLAYLFEPGGSPISLYEEGIIDIVYLGSEDFKRVSMPEDPLHNEMQTATRMCTHFILVSPDRAPLDDVNVRKALVQAIDKNELNDKYTSNINLIADSILPPAMPGYLEREPVKFDPVAAKKSLAASKYGNNLPPIKYVAAGYAGYTPLLLTLLSDMWKKNLGITVTIEMVDPTDPSKAMRNSDGNLIDYGWCADYPDPENFLDFLFHSQSDLNMDHLNRPEVDALLEKARTERDGTLRLQLYQQAEALLLDDVDVIPLFHSVSSVLIKPRIKGGMMPTIDVGLEPWLEIVAVSN